ncbi:MAG: hypothetical protein KY455_01715 [Euryarchaeota archaeon]|nr:hypothetical protein [Euryarchaeota archaeon]
MHRNQRHGLLATILGILLGGLGLGLLRIATVLEDYTILFLGFVLLAWGLAGLFGPTRHVEREMAAEDA